MRRVMVVATLVVATALAGCNSETAEDSTPSVPAQEDVLDIVDQPGSVEGYAGALEDSQVTTCETQDGRLVVEGTVTNPLDSAQDYRIYVSAMAGSDTRGLVQHDVTDVGPGSTADWAVTIDLSDPGLACVLRVERFPSS